MPKWIRHADGEEWRDQTGRRVGSPRINFAGKYYLAAHGCGTGCLYYTLTDLSSGRDINMLDMFSTMEPPPKTRDGRIYFTELFARPNSKMLVARYTIMPGPELEAECRERSFLFEDGRVKPISGARRAKCAG
jgi:hypothetical protein